MPITTPQDLIKDYNNDSKHFHRLLDRFFTPAIELAGFESISPVSTGSDIIHADIIKNLTLCEMVLCDISTLNPNVFFEFGEWYVFVLCENA